MKFESFLKQLLEHCGLAPELVDVEVDDQDVMEVTINLPEDESGLFIGHRGETLGSLQRICRVVFQESVGDKKLVLNINDYRQRRAERLKELAHQAGESVLETGQEYVFRTYFPPYERFLIHTALSEDERFSELESSSFGSGRDRRLVVNFKK